MSRIIPIPTTRVSDFFIRQRMVGQVQADQLDLFRLQTQVSTGRRIFLPSEDAPAALRAINLQRTLQRKDQFQTNLTGSASVLGAADASLNGVSKVLSDVRAAAIGVADTISSDDARQAVIQTIDQALAALVNSGNFNFNGRYLFAGTRTGTLPFDYNGQFVEYTGNEKNLRNYVDLGQLFETNIPGSDIFGGLSGEVRGDVDLNPRLTTDTLLSSVNGGEGIGTNAAISVSVTTGGTTTTNIVDLSGAATIGDVIRLIEASPVNVDVNINGQNGLTVQPSPGSTIRINEVAAGRTAKELGIFTPSTAVAGPSVVGTDLNAAVRKTTQLTDLLGTKAQGRLITAGSNNDLILTAAENGIALNDVTVVFDPTETAGNETASYDSNLNVLTVSIQDGASTAKQVAAAINAEGTFTAQTDYRDASSVTQKGSGAVAANTFFLATTGGSGEVLDTTSGLILTNGGESVTLDVSTAETVEDLLNLISGADVGLLAEINADGDGIDVRSVLSGADFTIGENGGTTGTQLGIRTYTGDTQLSALNRGIGVPTSDVEDDLLDPNQLDTLDIVAVDGVTLSINVSTATTLQDVVDLINNDPGTTAVTASLTADGHGIELVDGSTGGGNLTVLNTQAAEYLGFLPVGQPQIVDDGDLSLSSYRHSLEDDFLIVARDGTELWVDATGATTVQDVIDLVNNHSRNNEGTTAVLARLAINGNGIELVDSSTVTTNDLSVQAAEGSQAAEYLGLVPLGQTQSTSNATDGGGNYVLTSEDRHTLEVDSVFNSLIRLRTALENNDVVEIGRSLERLDVDLNRVNFARGEIGSRLQSLDIVRNRLQDESVQLQAALSEEIDVDLVEAISNLTARQYALQASLQTTASILNLSILDYI
jgi:flagellar hook-associated protein 3